MGFFAQWFGRQSHGDDQDCTAEILAGTLSDKDIRHRWSVLEDRVVHQSLLPGNVKEATTIAAYVDVNTGVCALEQKDGQFPDFFFKDIPETIAQRWLDTVTSPDSETNARMVGALAWCENTAIRARLASVAPTPPPGCVPDYLSRCAHEAGWHPCADGAVQALVYPALVTTRPAESGEAAVMGGALDRQCPRCASPMFRALSICASDPAFAFLGLPFDVTIPVCMSCFFCDWDDDDVPCDYIYLSPQHQWRIELCSAPSTSVVRVEGLMPASRAVGVAGHVWRNWVASQEEATIGGHPFWLQEADYRTCPSCGTVMRHLAAIPGGALCAESYGEEVMYLQLCTDCMIAAFVVQTT